MGTLGFGDCEGKIGAGGVSAMDGDWLVGEEHGEEKISIFLFYSSIRLVNLSSHARNLIGSFLALRVALHSRRFGKT
jgi:hypothetical protein